jgi:Flp pilus assembly protein TadB
VARRAVGIGTVMLLGLIPVAFGGLDWRTWATLLAGFLLAGAVLGVMLIWDRRAEKAARVERTRRALDEHIERWVGADAD